MTVFSRSSSKASKRPSTHSKFTPLPPDTKLGEVDDQRPGLALALPQPFTPSRTVVEGASPRPSSDSNQTWVNPGDADNTANFAGTVDTDNDFPTVETLRKIGDYPVLDQAGRSVPFKNLYCGPHTARRILVIFIRHFFCGNCQEYVRSIALSLPSPSDLLLPTPTRPSTSIVIIGCGAPSLIPMYLAETRCPYPIFADPTKRLYDELGMMRTLNMGQRPEYQRKEEFILAFSSFWQVVRSMRRTQGQGLKGMDMQQVGGEFLFEAVNADGEVDVSTPYQEVDKEQLGEEITADSKAVTWCHRMKSTRDHAEIPELVEVLGLDSDGPITHGTDEKRWSKAVMMRKGTGLSRSGSLATTSRKRSSMLMMDEKARDSVLMD